MDRWREIVPGGHIWSGPLNALADEVARLGKMIGEGIDVEDGHGGRLLRVPPSAVRIHARVWADTGPVDETGFPCDKTAYQWKQRRPGSCGTWEDDPFGIEGSVAKLNPAFAQGDQTIADNTDVELVPGFTYLNASNKVVQEWVILTGGSSGGDKRVRITSYFVKDTNPPHSLPISPLCFYPGIVQTLSAAGWTDTSQLVWVVFWYTYASVPPLGIGLPYTVVICDGTAAHDASPEGFDYAPDDGVHPNAGESRPVWGSAEYAAAWATQCVDGIQTVTLGG